MSLCILFTCIYVIIPLQSVICSHNDVKAVLVPRGRARSNPDSARGPQQSGFPPLIHFVSRWTQRSLLACRELVSLSLPSLSPPATLRVAQYFPSCNTLPLLLYLSSLHCIALRWRRTLCLSCTESSKETNIRSHLSFPKLCVGLAQFI